MNKNIKDLKGSPSRDLFKWAHKQLFPKSFWGFDLDLVLLSRKGILCALDYKKETDELTPVEIGGYNDLLEKGISIFIIVGEVKEPKDLCKLLVYKYNESQKFEKPNLELISKNYAEWEISFRGWGTKGYFSHLIKG